MSDDHNQEFYDFYYVMYPELGNAPLSKGMAMLMYGSIFIVSLVMTIYGILGPTGTGILLFCLFMFFAPHACSVAAITQMLVMSSGQASEVPVPVGLFLLAVLAEGIWSGIRGYKLIKKKKVRLFPSQGAVNTLAAAGCASLTTVAHCSSYMNAHPDVSYMPVEALIKSQLYGVLAFVTIVCIGLALRKYHFRPETSYADRKTIKTLNILAGVYAFAGVVVFPISQFVHLENLHMNAAAAPLLLALIASIAAVIAVPFAFGRRVKAQQRKINMERQKKKNDFVAACAVLDHICKAQNASEISGTEWRALFAYAAKAQMTFTSPRGTVLQAQEFFDRVLADGGTKSLMYSIRQNHKDWRRIFRDYYQKNM